jgi:hypothetical protein
MTTLATTIAGPEIQFKMAVFTNAPPTTKITTATA